MNTSKNKIQAFLEYLQNHSQERGMMADLRHGFSPTSQYRAWPHIAPWCDLSDQRQKAIFITLAGAFAIQLQSGRGKSNLGSTLRRLAVQGASGKPQDALKSFEARFRRLLTCNAPEQVCERLPGIIRAAERKGISIDLEQLHQDLVFWSDKVKLEWAKAYWGSEDDNEA